MLLWHNVSRLLIKKVLALMMFCVYAAYLHSVDLDRQVMGEFWIIQKIKSSFGLWEVGDKDKITK